MRAEEVVQQVKHLPDKDGDLSQVPRTLTKLKSQCCHGKMRARGGQFAGPASLVCVVVGESHPAQCHVTLAFILS